MTNSNAVVTRESIAASIKKNFPYLTARVRTDERLNVCDLVVGAPSNWLAGGDFVIKVLAGTAIHASYDDATEMIAIFSRVTDADDAAVKISELVEMVEDYARHYRVTELGLPEFEY
jgi:hypothetical protein